MEITVPLAAYVTSVAAMTTALALLVFRHVNPSVPGLSYWTWGALIQSAGITVVALRDPLPLWLSSSMGVGLTAAGTVLFYCGIRVYAGRAARLDIYLVPLGLLVLGNGAMLTMADSMAARVIAISVFFAVYALMSTIELSRIRTYGSRLPTDTLILLFVVNLVVNTIRAYALAVADDPRQVVAGALFQAGFFLWGAFHVVARDLMFVVLASQYIAKHTQDAVEEVRTLSLAIEASPLSCIITDANGAIEYVNDRFCQLTGYSRNECLGRRPSLMKSGYQPHETYADMWSTISRGEIWKGEMINRRKDGSVFTVLLAIAPLRGKDGRVVRYVGIHEDISARKEMERRLVTARQAAERANQAKSEFLTNMSHELRTPLNAILGFSQLLLMTPDEPVSERQADKVNQVIHAGEHLLTLINDILDLARIEAGRVSLTVARVAVDHLVSDCLPLIEPLAERNQVAIVPPADTQGLFITGDALRVKQVLVNLLSNAVKYNRRGGQVRLFCGTEPDGRIRIAVADDGIGIPAAKQAGLFTPFSRAVDAQSDIEGTGLGLALSRQLIQAMGGTLDFHSREGVGSTFWFVLPAAVVRPGDIEASPSLPIC